MIVEEKAKTLSKESERLVRLPLYYGLAGEEVEYVIQSVRDFYAFKDVTNIKCNNLTRY